MTLLEDALAELNAICDALEDRAAVLPEGPEHDARRNELVRDAYAAALRARSLLREKRAREGALADFVRGTTGRPSVEP